MKILGIPLAKFVWPAALVAAFLAGWLVASKSSGSSASAQQPGAPGRALRDVRSSGRDAAARQNRRGPRTSADPAADIVTIAQLEDRLQRTRALLALIDRLRPDDFEAVVASFRSLGIMKERMAEYNLLLAAWARVAPLAALAYLEGHPGSPSDRQTVLAAWALDDRDAAIGWAIENFETEGGGDNPWLAGVIGKLASTDLDRATSLIQKLPQSLGQKGTRQALNIILRTLSEQDSDSMMEWVGGLPNGPLRAGAARRVAMLLSGTNPEEVVRWAETLDPESRRQTYEELTQPWALRAPEEALAWAGTLKGESLHQVAEKITPAVAAKNPQLASRWLSQYDGDPAFDTARRRLVQHLSRDSPELAADWIGRITDVATGEQEFHRLLNPWLERDPKSVMRYVENHTTPESIRLRVLRTLAGEEAPTQ